MQYKFEYNWVQYLLSLVSPLFLTMSNPGPSEYEILNCYRAIYYVPINTDFMFVRHRNTKDKKTAFVRCRNYVSIHFWYSDLTHINDFGLSNEYVLFVNYQQRIIYSFAFRVYQKMYFKYSPPDQFLSTKKRFLTTSKFLFIYQLLYTFALRVSNKYLI